MDDAYGPLLFEDALSSEQRAKLRARLAEDPALADGWARWQQVRARLRERLQEHVPDRRLLVLYALSEEGREDLLTPEEAEALDAARPAIADALDAVPALQQVVKRVQDERADFETVWAQHREEIWAAEDKTDRRSQTDRNERAPRRPGRARREGAGRQWAWRLTVAALLLGAAVLAVVYGPQGAERTRSSGRWSLRTARRFGSWGRPRCPIRPGWTRPKSDASRWRVAALISM